MQTLIINIKQLGGKIIFIYGGRASEMVRNANEGISTGTMGATPPPYSVVRGRRAYLGDERRAISDKSKEPRSRSRFPRNPRDFRVNPDGRPRDSHAAGGRSGGRDQHTRFCPQPRDAREKEGTSRGDA